MPSQGDGSAPIVASYVAFRVNPVRLWEFNHDLTAYYRSYQPIRERFCAAGTTRFRINYAEQNSDGRPDFSTTVTVDVPVAPMYVMNCVACVCTEDP